MTVCIAAICLLKHPTSDPDDAPESVIVGVSDRMFSTADTGYEPQQTKIVNLTDKAVALIAGDIAGQAAICRATLQRIENQPATDVDTIAHILADEFSLYRRQEAERSVLAPLGLTLTDFVAKQGTMHAEQVKRLTDVLQGWQLEIATIVAGVDDSGGHVYRIEDPGLAICEDTSGFVAIGIGRNHAAAQFIRARFDPKQAFGRALSLTYSAKKRSEAAPGVGKDTDLFMIGSSFGYTPILNPSILGKLQAEHAKMVEKEEKALKGAASEVEKHIDAILKEAGESGQEDESGAARDES